MAVADTSARHPAPLHVYVRNRGLAHRHQEAEERLVAGEYRIIRTRSVADEPGERREEREVHELVPLALP